MLAKFRKKIADRKAIKERDIDYLMKEAFANYQDPFEILDEDDYTYWLDEISCRVCGKITCFNGSCERE